MLWYCSLVSEGITTGGKCSQQNAGLEEEDVFAISWTYSTKKRAGSKKIGRT